jgi:hypothetical protein
VDCSLGSDRAEMASGEGENLLHNCASRLMTALVRERVEMAVRRRIDFRDLSARRFEMALR